MEAKEVMPLDWLELKDFKAVQISGSAIYTDEDTTNSISFDDLEYNESAFKPIPLTEDILKANDFKRFEIKERFMTDEYIIDLIFMDKNLYCLSIDSRINEYYPYHIGLYIHYVHELQHALRLCGLSELADNFKLE